MANGVSRDRRGGDEDPSGENVWKEPSEENMVPQMPNGVSLCRRGGDEEAGDARAPAPLARAGLEGAPGPSATKVESGTSQSRNKNPVNFSNSGISEHVRDSQGQNLVLALR